MAYYCLHKFHWPPSYYLSLPEKEKAFLIAAIQMKVKSDEEQRREAERNAKKR